MCIRSHTHTINKFHYLHDSHVPKIRYKENVKTSDEHIVEAKFIHTYTKTSIIKFNDAINESFMDKKALFIDFYIHSICCEYEEGDM